MRRYLSCEQYSGGILFTGDDNCRTRAQPFRPAREGASVRRNPPRPQAPKADGRPPLVFVLSFARDDTLAAAPSPLPAAVANLCVPSSHGAEAEEAPSPTGTGAPFYIDWVWGVQFKRTLGALCCCAAT